MSEHTLIQLASIVVLGIAAQWVAWRIKFPSILFLLLLGFLAGPVTGFLNPDKLMGDLLLPVVSISVALILFEGGLTLRLSELKDVGGVVIALISIGAIITWAIAAAGAHFILKLDLRISILLGSILIVTGPTVIGPLLRHIKPVKRVGTILKWEGIMIDPVGAILAVLVFEAIIAGEVGEASSVVLIGLLKTIFFGGAIGLGFAGLLLLFLKRFWIPDILQESVAFILVITAFVLSNIFQPESGLFAATLMGLFLDNQKHVSIKHIIEFKENLRVIIISSIFILLAARLQISDFEFFNLAGIVFLGLLIFIARPLSVFVSTLFSDLNWRERTFISWLAPRGIVAAAVSSVFALKLAETGIPGSEFIVPITFIVIIVTVGIYGLTSPIIAKWLKVAQSDPQGVLIVGAHSWAIEFAKILNENKIRVVLVDTNYSHISDARLEGLTAYQGSILSEHLIDEIDLNGIGRMMALTSNDEANSLASLHLREEFESGELYQLSPLGKKDGDKSEFSAKHLRARFLFKDGMNFDKLNDLFMTGWIIKNTGLTKEFTYEDFLKNYNNNVVILFWLNENNKLGIATVENDFKPETAYKIIALVKET
ncbi:MAG: cation:proton antiporter [Ignavibacteriaceae bacterium]|nr:cation:proton antiporter [Ignavibacteriaceae bacterium]